MKMVHDRRHSPLQDYKVGDQVWLEATHIKSDHPTKKFDDKWYGPFVILSNHGESAYKLQLPKTWRSVYPIFNECVLTPYWIPIYNGAILSTLFNGRVFPTRNKNGRRPLSSIMQRRLLQIFIIFTPHLLVPCPP